MVQLKDTAVMMTSPDFKERFRGEYFQLKIRITGLEAMLEKYKAGTLPFKPKCSYDLLKAQLDDMKSYKQHLEQRAQIEDVDLKEPEANETN